MLQDLMAKDVQQLLLPSHDFSWHYGKNVHLKCRSCIIKVISSCKHYLQLPWGLFFQSSVRSKIDSY